MFTFNKITRILCSPEGEVLPQGSSGSFDPIEVTQGVGLFDEMKNKATEMQTSEEETGSVSLESATATSEDDKDDNKQTADDSTQVEEKATDELIATNEDTTTEEDSTGYIYKGVEVNITNTPEMTESFKEKGLDIDAVNKELYSKDGITEETRGKLDEAFGKASVDMYLEGLATKNDAMIASAEADTTALNKRLDEVTNEATGDKFDEVIAWAKKNLDGKEYTKYADIINGTDEFQIELALKSLTSQANLQSNKLDQPEVSIKVADRMINSDVVNQTSEDGAITAKEYQASFANGDYRKDMNKWDRRRAAGMDAGI